ncbi:hypothetical protein OCV66_15190, partial [Agathobaculum ammoniilyticum]
SRFTRLPPMINFSLFAPLLAVTQNLGLPPLPGGIFPQGLSFCVFCGVALTNFYRAGVQLALAICGLLTLLFCFPGLLAVRKWRY